MTEIAFYAVNDAVCGVLDVAGLGPEADEVRSAVASAGDVASLLRGVAAEARGPWAPVIREVCFWAEAIVWAAWRSDAVRSPDETVQDGEFEELRNRLEKAISDGYAQMALH